MRTSILFSAALLLLSFSLLAASQIRADGINYSYTSGGTTFTWELPTNPVIAAGNAYPGEGFTIPGLSFSESNNPVPMVGIIDFFNSLWGGGFDLKSGGGLLINAYGPQLYTGPESAPTMLMGTFSTIDYGSDTSGATAPTSVSTLALTSVPEPSTLSLLAIGLAIGLALTFLRFAKIGLAPSTH
ncbi:MAG: PEP-CTERM sorting domain-containing protein [Candidatus Acidiferrum sp.]